MISSLRSQPDRRRDPANQSAIGEHFFLPAKIVDESLAGRHDLVERAGRSRFELLVGRLGVVNVLEILGLQLGDRVKTCFDLGVIDLRDDRQFLGTCILLGLDLCISLLGPFVDRGLVQMIDVIADTLTGRDRDSDTQNGLTEQPH